ncbi:MAG TPA: TA system VapC family ribonuclease toxin [Vicinamibacterales bacterium]|nr:TA system VapC family ribonuclease toxin [Vicinamibacterales bacterium]
MIAVDTNILIYAHREEFSQHRAARKALVQLAEGPAAWALPVFCLGEFLRISTHPRLFNPPFSAKEATEALRRVLASPSVRVLIPGAAYPDLLLRAVRDSGATGNLVFDAQIAALCEESGVSTLLTEDRDFARFPSVRSKRLDG